MSLLKYLLFSILIVSCIGSKNVQELNTVQSWVFTKQEFIGNLQVDENGNPINKGYWLKHFIVVETSDTNIVHWQKILVNSNENILIKVSKKDSTFTLDFDEINSKRTIIQTNKKNIIFLFETEDYTSTIPIINPTIKIIGKIFENEVFIIIKKTPILIENLPRP